MNKSKNSIVRQFWSHVFCRSNEPAYFVPNDSPRASEVIALPAGPFNSPSVVTIEKPSHLCIDWQTAGHLVSELMLQLKKLGFERGDRVALLSWNCAEWVWMDMAIQSLGGASVPIYPNSAPDQVAYILKDSGAKLLFADAKDQIAKVSQESGVKAQLFSEVLSNAPDYRGSRRLMDTPINQPNELVFRQETLDETERVKHEFKRSDEGASVFLGVKGEDLATLIYTSGSTGVPKGVALLHENIASACESLKRHGFELRKDDRYLSYLPLAHVYERVNGTCLCLWEGIPSTFCRVDEMAEVVKQVRPTVLLGVPAVWRKIKDKAEAQLNAATGLKARLIAWALKQRKPGWRRSLADFLVFRKIRAALGGEVRIMLSGGAPIAKDILSFFELVSVEGKAFVLRQGYGLTETSGGIAVNTMDNNKEGSVGRLIDSVEAFIVPADDGVDSLVEAEKILPETGSNSTFRKAVNGHRPGLIFLRGSCITPGYWQLDEENAKSFTKGWFNTGDLGRIDEDGYLWITGRKKRLLKTDGGKYVAPEKVENAFEGLDELVQYVVPVGDGKPFIGALVFLNQARAEALTGKKADAEFYSRQPELLSLVKDQIERANSSLERWETIKQFTIVPVEASVNNGLLTNKLSIRTEEVLRRYEELVEELYTRVKS